MDTRILLVEDDPTLRETLAYRLRTEGMTVIAVATGEEAIASACVQIPDVIVLDLMLPGMDGITTCKQLRACCATPHRVPIIMLTALSDESDMISGLEAGADDYVSKPYSWLELRARIRAQLRRLESATDEQPRGVLVVGSLRIDLDQHLVWRDAIAIELTTRLFELLVYFVQNNGMILTRNRLLERVWGFDYAGETNTVNVHVHWLREKLQIHSDDPDLIQTVRGVGYRFKA